MQNLKNRGEQGFLSVKCSLLIFPADNLELAAMRPSKSTFKSPSGRREREGRKPQHLHLSSKTHAAPDITASSANTAQLKLLSVRSVPNSHINTEVKMWLFFFLAQFLEGLHHHRLLRPLTSLHADGCDVLRGTCKETKHLKLIAQ